MKGRYCTSSLALCLFGGLLLAGCGPKDTDSTTGGGDGQETSIRVEGSDTMVNLAQAWAETYKGKRADISVEVSGGGSGVGIASLINGTCDMANASRKMKDEELQNAVEQHGIEPVEHIVGFDALAVYVHKDNPVDSISIEELSRNLRRWRSNHRLVANRKRRRSGDHPRQPTEQLRHLRLFPRGRPGKGTRL